MEALVPRVVLLLELRRPTNSLCRAIYEAPEVLQWSTFLVHGLKRITKEQMKQLPIAFMHKYSFQI